MLAGAFRSQGECRKALEKQGLTGQAGAFRSLSASHIILIKICHLIINLLYHYNIDEITVIAD